MDFLNFIDIYFNMETLQELGEAVAQRRKELKYRQAMVATQTGITAETLSRFERGKLTEFGARKLLSVLAVLGMELRFSEKGMSGSLDELRKERGL
ncbi:helix-turn-helix transcriptional regulator [Phragmitibacter flavus]|uniref:Helix-turn-helix transcriptional regulator n=1 Tax=Phragmitibacter flavus TaxID=2576071 RepID=A0A5R8KI65_9BACT|nr:XRE family transcriptional regulator [Phragmitibacter flavus]TLD71675.1 helix-turn-helix transcriptional regulator [Phragmitibacter flavus]